LEKPAESCVCPAIFAHSEEDEMIKPHHVEKLFESYGGKKKHIIKFEGTHNAHRPSWFTNLACKFLTSVLNH
jgi:hypothetical protein